MKVTPLKVEGAVEFTPLQHQDPRGAFMEMYRHDLLTEIVGHPLTLAQAKRLAREAGLGVMCFMHLGSENRSFVIFVAVFTLFVLAAMQYGWTDSYRMERGAPNANYKTGAVQ